MVDTVSTKRPHAWQLATEPSTIPRMHGHLGIPQQCLDVLAPSGDNLAVLADVADGWRSILGRRGKTNREDAR